MATVTIRKQTDDHLVPDYQQAASLFPTLAYSPEDELFYMQDFSIGFAFRCEPIPGGDDRVQDRLASFLNSEYPEGTMIQMVLYRSPDITMHSNHALQLRDGYRHPLLTPTIEERVAFFERYARDPLFIKSQEGLFDNGLVQDLKLIIAFKMPIDSTIPSEQELEYIKTTKERAKSSLNMLGLAPRPLDAKGYKRVMGTMCNWGSSASWKTGFDDWEQERLISDQILDFDSAIEVKKNHLEIGDYYARTLSAKKLPAAYYFGNALSYIGDMSGRGNAVKENYMVVATIYYPPAKVTKDVLETKRKFTINQAQGPMLKFVPVLGEKKESFDILYGDLGNGAVPLQMSFSVVMFAPTLDRLDSASTAIKDFFSEQRFSLMEDRYVHLPMFLNSLPFCCDRNSVKDLHRYKTMTGNQAAVLVPIFGEWKGSGKHHLSLLSRNGQLMSLSLHSANTNKNCVIAAESGSGKSFLANDMIVSYMSIGAQVWVIDAGKSYKNLCEILGGNFLEFSEGSNIRLNPFEIVDDYEEEEDGLVSLVTSMASQDGNLDEYQVASIKQVMKNLWVAHGNKMNVDMIAAACRESDDRRVKDIGIQLYAFTSQGAYGKYFSDNNIDFSNNFTVLELDELQGRRHLRQVILLQLIYQIQQTVFLGNKEVPKLLLVDEAWDLLKDGEVATFMEHAYRKFRKSNASAIICTQSISDLYQNSVGQAIAENSATMLLLGQTNEAIETVKRAGYLSLPEGGFDVLRTVQTVPGVYSEIFIKSKAGMGVGRLVVGEFQKLLYSTDPVDVNAINAYRRRGMGTTEAIRAVMSDRGVGE